MKHSGDGLLPLNPCWLSPMEQHKSVLDLKELLTPNKLHVFTKLDSVNLLPHDYLSMTNVLIYSHYDLRLTHWGRVTHICVGNFYPSLVQITACRLVGTKSLLEPMLGQWNVNRNLIQENPFENVVWKMAAIFLGLNMLNI